MAVFAEMVRKSEYVKDERASNKPVFHIFDKFCLLDSPFFDVQYMATLVLAQSMNFYFEQEDWRCLRDF